MKCTKMLLLLLGLALPPAPILAETVQSIPEIRPSLPPPALMEVPGQFTSNGLQDALAQYRRKLDQAVAAQCAPSGDLPRPFGYVLYTLHPEGHRSDVSLARTTGNPALDQCLLDVVRSTAATEPIPELNAAGPLRDTQTLTPKDFKDPNEYLEFIPYFNDLQTRIRTWRKEHEKDELLPKSYSVEVHFCIVSTGEIIHSYVSSANSTPEKAVLALNALRQIQPLAPLPSRYPLGGIDAQILFNYNVLGPPPQ